jgi:tRNA(Arg) A34 adenosine deaminase TadA
LAKLQRPILALLINTQLPAYAKPDVNNAQRISFVLSPSICLHLRLDLMKQKFMREAIRLSIKMMRLGKGGPFGAIVVMGNKIVGRGCNQVTSSNDPTAHAEIVAIRDACRRLKTFSLFGCDLYTSCEPCPMCLSAIYWARIGSVFYGNTRKDAAKIAFDDAKIYHEVGLPIRERELVMKQLLRKEALAAFTEWEEKADKIRY